VYVPNEPSLLVWPFFIILPFHPTFLWLTVSMILVIYILAFKQAYSLFKGSSIFFGKSQSFAFIII